MKSSLLNKLMLVVTALAVALVVNSSGFAQGLNAVIGIEVSSLSLNASGTIQMAQYAGNGNLSGGKIVYNTFVNSYSAALNDVNGSMTAYDGSGTWCLSWARKHE